MSFQLYFKKSVLPMLLILSISVLAFTGCSNQNQTSGGAGGTGAKVVLNEVAHSIFYAPMYVAIEEGYFKDAGIDLELVTGFGAVMTVQNQTTVSFPVFLIFLSFLVILTQSRRRRPK